MYVHHSAKHHKSSISAHATTTQHMHSWYRIRERRIVNYHLNCMLFEPVHDYHNPPDLYAVVEVTFSRTGKGH